MSGHLPCQDSEVLSSCISDGLKIESRHVALAPFVRYIIHISTSPAMQSILGVRTKERRGNEDNGGDGGLGEGVCGWMRGGKAQRSSSAIYRKAHFSCVVHTSVQAGLLEQHI